MNRLGRPSEGSFTHEAFFKLASPGGVRREWRASRLRTVEIGRRNDEEVEVVGGLREGVRIAER